MSYRHRFVAIIAAVLVAGLLVAPSSGATDQRPGWCADRSSLVVLGDSGSTGYGMPDYSGGQVHDATVHGWTSRVARNAEAGWGTDTTVIAHNGAMASDFLSGGRWADTRQATDRIRAIQPSLVIVELGGNEFYIDKPISTFANEYRALVDRIRSAAPGATIVLVIIWEIGERQPANPANSWSAYGTAIRDVAIDGPHGLVDLRQYLPPAAGPAATGFYLPDRIHLTAPGNAVVTAAIWTLLWAGC